MAVNAQNTIQKGLPDRKSPSRTEITWSALLAVQSATRSTNLAEVTDGKVHKQLLQPFPLFL